MVPGNWCGQRMARRCRRGHAFTILRASTFRRSAAIMRRSLLLFVLLLLASPAAVMVRAQQAPAFGTVKFETNVSHRSPICDRHLQLVRDEVELPLALQGLNLTVGFINYNAQDDPDNQELFSLTEEGVIKEENPPLFAVIMVRGLFLILWCDAFGLLLVCLGSSAPFRISSSLTFRLFHSTIQDELALRAGFSWRNSYGVADPLDERDINQNRTWSDLLKWSTEVYDIAMGQWDRTAKRIAKEISFPEGFADSSIILVQLDTTENLNWDRIWTFLLPFEPTVWWLIFFSLTASGILYYVLELLDDSTDSEHLETRPASAIYYSFITFTGHHEFHPQTHSARLLAFSMTFWALIMAGALLLYVWCYDSRLIDPPFYPLLTLNDLLRSLIAAFPSFHRFLSCTLLYGSPQPPTQRIWRRFWFHAVSPK